MKQSGIDWISEIPDGWKISKIDSLYIPRNEKVSDKDYPPLSVTMQGVVPQLATAAKSDDGDNRKLVRKGDFAINSRSDRRGSSGVSAYDGSVSLINTILTPRDEMNPIYYNWLFHTTQFEDEFYKWGHGIVDDLWTTRWQDMKNIYIPVPPLAEQQKIAAYLDKKVSQIDALINEAKLSVEEYKAWKQSVIFEAVTGKANGACHSEHTCHSEQSGVAREESHSTEDVSAQPQHDGFPKMKPSGVEWIGEIPNNWEVCKIKHIATLAGRIGWQGLTSQEYSDNGAFLITGINFKNGKIDWKSCVHVPYSRWNEATQIQIKNGDLLITKDGTVGKVAIVDEISDKTTLNSGVMVIRQDESKCATRFLYYVLQSDIFWKWFNYINSGNSTIIHLYQHDFLNFSFPLPPLTSQLSLVTYLDTTCAKIDSLIAEKESLAADLAEYKKSLIFEVVTGKKQVSSCAFSKENSGKRRV